MRDSLLKASKLQTDVIGKVAEACFASRLIRILSSAIPPRELALRQYVSVLAGQVEVKGVDLNAAATPLVQ